MLIGTKPRLRQSTAPYHYGPRFPPDYDPVAHWLNPRDPTRTTLHGFVEADGYVSIEAEHYTKKNDGENVRWEKIDDYGRTLSSMTVFPVTAKSVTPPANSPSLEYQMYVFHPGKVEVEAILAPTLNFVPGRGLRYAISFDDQPPQIVDALARNSVRDWGQSR